MEEGKAAGLEFARELGCASAPDTLDCLRKAPLARILEVQTALAVRLPRAFSPSTGSAALPRDGTTALRAGKVLRVPLLNGGTRDEMRLYVGYEVAAGATVTRNLSLKRACDAAAADDSPPAGELLLRVALDSERASE